MTPPKMPNYETIRQQFVQGIFQFLQQTGLQQVVNPKAEPLSVGKPSATSSPTILDVVPRLALPPSPNFDGLRNGLNPSAAIPKENGNADLILAIGRLENVMKQVQSPVLNQTNSTTNHFEAGARKFL